MTAEQCNRGADRRLLRRAMRAVGSSLILLVVLGSPSWSSEVVINELMYHAASDDPGDEYIELYNRGASPVDVSGWCFEGVQFCFPGSTTIAAGAYVVLASDAARFATTYAPATADHEYLLQLDDGGERVALLNDLLVVQDEVSYGDRRQWPVLPDGLGPSLELIDATADNDLPRSWAASTDVSGWTPGAVNAVAGALPPWLDEVSFPTTPADLDPLLVTARVLDGTSATLRYVLDFGSCMGGANDGECCTTDLECGGGSCTGGEVSLALNDLGTGGDVVAADGVWSASIPPQTSGTLVRLRLEATGPTGTASWPRVDDTVTYTGTAVLDTVSTALPVLQWFMCDTDYDDAVAHKFTDELEPALIYYDGRLYDGVDVRVRGSSVRGFLKTPWKFFFRQGHDFEGPGLIERPVDTFNVQAGYTDKSHLREILAWETLRDSGGVASSVAALRLHRNGQFFGLYTFLEAADNGRLARNGLDSAGARYKAFNNLRPGSLSSVQNDYEKETRLEEGHEELLQLISSLAVADEATLAQTLRDTIDIPSMLNYLAVQTLIHNNDHIVKNYFMYRDSDGTGRWTMHAWDLDLTFGRNYDGIKTLNDSIWADIDLVEGKPLWVSPSHPLFGDSGHRAIYELHNHLIDRLHADDELRAMYFRRLRTLLDQFFADGFYEDWIDQLATAIAPEAALDLVEWPQWGTPQTLTQAVQILKDDYLAPRRFHLLTTHAACDLPESQTAAPPILINEIMYAPPGGDDDEYVELYNPSTTEAVDLSGWRLEGVALTVPAGTVILPEQYLLFVRNDSRFRATYGGGRFIGGQYKGKLSNTGEALVLRNRNGAVATAVRYEAVAPWPLAANGGGASLELIDRAQPNGRVANWSASPAGGTPGEVNASAGTIVASPALFLNELVPTHVGLPVDNAGDNDPWFEIYNASQQTISLAGLTIDDDPSGSDPWPLPAVELCGGCYELVWGDGEWWEGAVPIHTPFALSTSGGFVGLFLADGTIVDYIKYGAIEIDHGLARIPDGSTELRDVATTTPAAPNVAPQIGLILNEYNATAPGQLLDAGNVDTYWGRVPGNGGDWFELVVTGDHLDLRGWRLELRSGVGGPGPTLQTLTFSTDPLWSDLRAGTILTVSESLADDVGFNPLVDDWWINVQAASAGSGVYITAQDFDVTNDQWQLTIVDDLGQPVFGPAGEGVIDGVNVGSDEVYKLEQDPGPMVIPTSEYNDGTSSSFGEPNIFAAGGLTQDFSELRAVGSMPPCAAPDSDGDGWCDTDDNCPSLANADQANADADGSGDPCDPCPFDPADDADQDGVCAEIDVCPFLANPAQFDSDGDGVGNACDLCPTVADPDQQDGDLDGAGDACDACPTDQANDSDGDGLCESADNCPGLANAGQSDLDADLLGDSCDPCPADGANDADLDGVCVGSGFHPPKVGDGDNCPTLPNANQIDGDADGVGDSCDLCPSDADPLQLNTDADGDGDACDDDDDDDGVLDVGDNCPLVPDPDQTDLDGDGLGNVCDPDDDADGVEDNVDNCDEISNVGQLDADADGAGDLCDCSASPSVGAQPAAIPSGLRMGKSQTTTTLSWTHGPQAHLYNLYRGTFDSAGPWSYDEQCLASELSTPSAIDSATPVAGNGFYYLVAGRNVCGDGPAGEGASGPVLPAPTCPLGAGDADGDGVSDLVDNCADVQNPSQADSDQDFVGDLCDLCATVAGDAQIDLDQDGAGDECDQDDDGDGVPDAGDNCPRTPNADQLDGDRDDIGDECDACTDLDGDGLGEVQVTAARCEPDPVPGDIDNDADGDGTAGPIDNCPDRANQDQADGDLDGIGDVCDLCPGDPLDDEDGDGLCAGPCGAIDVVTVESVPPFEQLLIAESSPMRYQANLDDLLLVEDWVLPAFDDSGWGVGSYGVGYEAIGGAEALVTTSVPVGTRSVFTRATFQIVDPAEVTDLFLGLDYDDGVVAWINGVEVYRSPEMPDGPVNPLTRPFAHESSNGSEPDYGEPLDISLPGVGALQPGTNVLAIGVWNHLPTGAPSSDLVLVPRLSSNRLPSMTWFANDQPPVFGMSWVDEAFDDSAWSGGQFGIGYDVASGNALGLIETVVPSGKSSIYTRATFEIDNLALVDRVMIGADYDDGYAVWLNGVELYRSEELPAGPLAWDTAADLHESSNGTSPLLDPAIEVSGAASGVLREGFNLLAIGVWNASAGSSDLVLFPALSISGSFVDNCPTRYNPDQADLDRDGIGDVCDNCPSAFNPPQTDSDADGAGDACSGP